VPIAVATSSHRRHFDIKTQSHRALCSLFDAIITGDMCAHGKPHPEIFQTAAAAFVRPPGAPSAALVFEDAPSGIQAALAAGMSAVMVPDPQMDQGLVAGLGATAVLRSLEEFVPEQWGLPAYAASTGAAGALPLPN
jgi:pseudouridine-5'-monophosphatase